jgi:hypothetical protein
MQSGRQNTNGESWRDLESIGFVVKRTQNSRAHTGEGTISGCPFWDLNGSAYFGR